MNGIKDFWSPLKSYYDQTVQYLWNNKTIENADITKKIPTTLDVSLLDGDYVVVTKNTDDSDRWKAIEKMDNVTKEYMNSIDKDTKTS